MPLIPCVSPRLARLALRARSWLVGWPAGRRPCAPPLQGAAPVFFINVVTPGASPEKLAEAEKTLKFALKFMDGVLQQDRFLAGAQPTLADLSAFEEVAQLEMVPFDLGSWPNVRRWTADMKALPHYATPHAALGKVAAKRAAAKAKL